MKLTLRFLILTAILVAVAGLCGGWKWDAIPGKRKAADYALIAADPNGSVSLTSADVAVAPGPVDPNGSASTTSTDKSRTLAPADPNGSASSTATDSSITLTPADANGLVPNTPADTSSTTDGWTWD